MDGTLYRGEEINPPKLFILFTSFFFIQSPLLSNIQVDLET